MTRRAFEPVVVTAGERERFRRDGFLVLDRPLLAPAEVAQAHAMVQRLFDRFDRLPDDLAYDLGDVQDHDGPQEIPEILSVTALEPRLAETAAFRRCLDLARQLLGRRAVCTFDHAICKPAHGEGSAIGWHQDLSYVPDLVDPDRQVNIWLALQDVTESSGCMRYIAEQGSGGLLAHRRRGDRTEAHALVAHDVDATAARSFPLAAGMVTIHRMTTLHGSGPNVTDAPRLAWVLHFRPRSAMSPIRVRLGRVRRSIFSSSL